MAVGREKTGQSMDNTFDVAVVGGGVVGSSIAYFLSQNSAFNGRIVVIERDQTYAASSSSLSASAIRQQFATLPNIQMSKWSIKFLREARDLLTVEDYIADLGLHERGYLFLGGPSQRELFKAKHDVQQRAGVKSQLLSSEELRQRYPELRTDDIAIGSVGLADEGWFDGPALHQAYRRKARTQGVIYNSGNVVAFEREGSRVIGVKLDSGETVHCDSVVISAGAWSGALGKMAGIEVPVIPRKRCVFVLDSPAAIPGGHFIHDTSGVWVRPEGSLYICGTTPELENEPEDYSLNVDYSLFDDLIWPALANRIPAFNQLRMLRAWAGLYEYNLFDQSAIIGKHPELSNLILATGFSGHGMMHSPATGLGVSELIIYGQYQTLDLTAFGIERISANAPIPEHVY